MFRGGGPMRGTPALSGSGSRTLLADISEFQANLNDAAYLNWSKALVIRAAYGMYHDDQAWYGGARRAAFWAGGGQWLGIYQYLVAGQDAAAQARELIRLVGTLHDGETLICDLEEGGGSQQGRWLAWRGEILAAYPQYKTRPRTGPELYSGLYFGNAAGLSPSWLADYTSAEPGQPHWMWQFSSSWNVPGVGACDCSLFHGTAAGLRATATAGGKPPPSPPPPPPPSDWTAQMIASLPVVSAGATGGAVRRIQGLLVAAGQNIAVDGIFGSGTASAVAAVQGSHGLTQDSVVGINTWTVLVTGAA
jgi:hypothetical protein